ncbi:mRNA-binding ribosome synthesis protein nop7 [Malassezia caprae]|uniref:Pescadillo homolog n=1 Tax=Malassezia caprae TaxID=1381934 RepID=A0AAF0IV19_9BASI|nr:mRNA-binding ribosome synthesis protein nop7 [Malassezia caprae]
MARIKKRGESGAAKNYITRNQALKKLQVTLAEFRRLCILKGIFPRQPRHIKRANKGSTAPTTFYYAKDIAYLQHEPVLQAFREHKAFAKKMNRAIARREWFAAKNLDDHRPQYRLDHIIKERYPTFVDSLRDLDDAISMLFLFANIPSQKSIAPEITTHCARLCTEWQLYVMRTRCLSKVFLSIKGIYFQAVVHGQEITWLVPYMFTQTIPSDVDFRVMMTFLELYQTLMGFVLFKLYTDENLVYPPKLDEDMDNQGAGFGSLVLMAADADVLSGKNNVGAPQVAEAASKNAIVRKDGKKLSARDVKRQIARLTETETDEAMPELDTTAAEEPADDDNDTFVAQTSKRTSAEEDAGADVLTTLGDLQQQASENPVPTLFTRYVFYISREVPRAVFEFILRSFGALPEHIGWDPVAGAGSHVSEDDARITHHILDRPVTEGQSLEHAGHRVCVQPQWVVDCVNARKLLPTDPYRPGQTLPPHLSPFVDDREVARQGGYVPAEARAALGMEEDAVVDDEDDEDDEDEDDEDDEEEAPAPSRPARDALLADPHGAGLLEAAELEAEAAGGEDALLALREAHAAAIKAAKKKNKKAGVPAALSEEAEAQDMAKTLLSNKQRKLYNRLDHAAGKKKEDKLRLEAKKRMLSKKKAA